MLLLKALALLAGLGISLVAAGLVLYDACLAVNFQRHATRTKANTVEPEPDFSRPSVFLYQRSLAEHPAPPADVQVLRIRRRVRAWRRTGTG